MERKLQQAANETRQALQKAQAFFEFKIVNDFYITGDLNISKNASTVFAEVRTDIQQRVQWLLTILSSVNNVLALTLLLLFVTSLLYIKNYRSKDHFDNIYITQKFKKMDEICKSKKQEFVLPLTPVENINHIDVTEKRLSLIEKLSVKYGLKAVAIHLIIAVIIIAFDYILHYSLLLVEKYGGVALLIDGMNTIDVDIQGEGVFAILLRAVVDTLTVNDTFAVDLNFTKCLPNPTEPNINHILAVTSLYLVTLTFTILSAYGLRLRRAIAASFYPEQEKVRIHYLHEKLVHGRMTIVHWLRDLVLMNLKKGKVRERMSFRAFIGYKYPRFAKLCLPDPKTCLSCDRLARRGMIFCKCTTKSCTAQYCEDCFKAMQRYCLVCESKNELKIAEK